MANKLAARIRARNRCATQANRLAPILLDTFRPLVGKKILKKDGSFLAKYENLLPEFPNNVALNVIRYWSDYNLAWEVKACESFEDYGCCYESTVVYIGNLEKGELKSLCEFTPLRIDWTEEEIIRLREEYRLAELAMREARSRLSWFGEYD